MTRLSLDIGEADTLSSLARYALRRERGTSNSSNEVRYREHTDRLLKLLEGSKHSVALQVAKIMLGQQDAGAVDERLLAIADGLKKRADKDMGDGMSGRAQQRSRLLNELRLRSSNGRENSQAN